MKTSYKRDVTFLDKNMALCTVSVEICGVHEKRTDKETLEECVEDTSVSVFGSSGLSAGQCAAEITPRTESQKELLDFWRRYHLDGMSLGTTLQNEYLDSGKYMEDLRGIARSGLLDCLGETDTNDFRAQKACLRMNGLYEDRGYKFGDSWLFAKTPGNIREIADGICDRVEADERLLAESAGQSVDMGAADFRPTADTVCVICQQLECGPEEAKAFIAIGTHLKTSSGLLGPCFRKLSDCLYEAFGTEWYAGTDRGLEDIASEAVHDGDYKVFWTEAVRDGRTELGFDEWADGVLSESGWCNVLNSYDGKSFYYETGGGLFAVSRA